MLEITLTWVSGYRRSPRGRDNAPFIRSITHAPDQTYIRLQLLHCLFDLTISQPFWIIPWIETIFMEFRGPKALANLHGCRLIGQLASLGFQGPSVCQVWVGLASRWLRGLLSRARLNPVWHNSASCFRSSNRTGRFPASGSQKRYTLHDLEHGACDARLQLLNKTRGG